MPYSASTASVMCAEFGCELPKEAIKHALIAGGPLAAPALPAVIVVGGIFLGACALIAWGLSLDDNNGRRTT